MASWVPPSNDENIYMPYRSFLKIYYSGQRSGVESHITVKGLDKDIGLVELEAELRGLMRKKRSLKPKEEDTFALNRPEAIANFIGSTFDVIGLAGWVIGGFSILVGGFGIANIMFVSVRERNSHYWHSEITSCAKTISSCSQFLFGRSS